jgi:hypothetical protein
MISATTMPEGGCPFTRPRAAQGEGAGSSNDPDAEGARPLGHPRGPSASGWSARAGARRVGVGSATPCRRPR